MIIFGVTTNPIDFCLWMNENNQKYSFNCLQLFKQNVVFDSLFNLLVCRHKIGKRRVIVFDAQEKLVTLKGIKIITSKNIDELKSSLLSKQYPLDMEKIEIENINYIARAIESNNVGIMHAYNTSLYQIKSKELRDKLKQLILQYSSGNISFKQITDTIEELKFVRRNLSTKKTVEDLLNLIQSEEFGRIRSSIIEINKLSKVNDDIIEVIAIKNKVEPFDVRYLYHVLNK